MNRSIEIQREYNSLLDDVEKYAGTDQEPAYKEKLADLYSKYLQEVE